MFVSDRLRYWETVSRIENVGAAELLTPGPFFFAKSDSFTSNIHPDLSIQLCRWIQSPLLRYGQRDVEVSESRCMRVRQRYQEKHRPPF